MIEIAVWQYWLMLILAIIGGLVVILFIIGLVGALINCLIEKINDYQNNYLKYKEYYWKHHITDGLFECETFESDNEGEAKE